nr:oocyte-secreted protein 4B [Oryctolagus cuniculus]
MCQHITILGFFIAVTSVCSDDWLVARIRKRPFDNDTEVRIGDIHLGNSCLVTRMLSFNYEFSYPIIYCGIKKFIFQGNDVFILSEINYKPRLDTSYTFPVVCFMKRLIFSSLVTFGLNGHEINLLSDSSQVRRVQQSSISFQSEKCEPDFSSVQKEQLNHCINNACVMTSP